jgi:hypothetical protein
VAATRTLASAVTSTNRIERRVMVSILLPGYDGWPSSTGPYERSALPGCRSCRVASGRRRQRREARWTAAVRSGYAPGVSAEERPKPGDVVKRRDESKLGRVVKITRQEDDHELAWVEWEESRFPQVSVPVPVDHLVIVRAA